MSHKAEINHDPRINGSYDTIPGVKHYLTITPKEAKEVIKILSNSTDPERLNALHELQTEAAKFGELDWQYLCRTGGLSDLHDYGKLGFETSGAIKERQKRRPNYQPPVTEENTWEGRLSFHGEAENSQFRTPPRKKSQSVKPKKTRT